MKPPRRLSRIERRDDPERSFAHALTPALSPRERGRVGADNPFSPGEKVAGASRPDEGKLGPTEIRAMGRAMLLIDCPYCGMARPEIEFAYGGEAHIARAPDPSALSDEEWANFLYFRSNPKGVLAERWRHTFGCGRFFNCLRDTLSDKIIAVYKAGEPRPDVAGERAEPSE